MMRRIVNRSDLKTTAWLASVMAQPWNSAAPIPSDGCRIQNWDSVAHLEAETVNEQLLPVFEQLAEAHPQDISDTDGEMATAVHKACDGLTRREASDAAMWAWHCACGLQQYVRWRWTTKSENAFWLRMAGNVRRNALARLWWWAEITHDPSKDLNDPERYAITREVARRQDLILWCGDCAFSGNPTVVLNLHRIQETKGLGGTSQQKLCRAVNRMLQTVCIDALSDEVVLASTCDSAYALSRKL
jgi:hypothetical protein